MHEGLTQVGLVLVRPRVHERTWHVPGALLRTSHSLNHSMHTHNPIRDTLFHKHTLEMSWVQFQTTIIKQISQQSESHKSFSFPGDVKVMLTLYVAY